MVDKRELFDKRKLFVLVCCECRDTWGNCGIKCSSTMAKTLTSTQTNSGVVWSLRDVKMWYGASLGGPKILKTLHFKVFLCPISINI